MLHPWLHTPHSIVSWAARALLKVRQTGFLLCSLRTRLARPTAACRVQTHVAKTLCLDKETLVSLHAIIWAKSHGYISVRPFSQRRRLDISIRRTVFRIFFSLTANRGFSRNNAVYTLRDITCARVILTDAPLFRRLYSPLRRKIFSMRSLLDFNVCSLLMRFRAKMVNEMDVAWKYGK